MEKWTCNPRLWVRISAPAGIVHDWGETLEQGTEPPTAPRRRSVGCTLLQMCVCVCARGWVKCRKHISLLVILCIIVYVTNKEKKNIILQNRYSIMVKCLNIGENIGKPIYLPISSHNQMLCDWLTGTPMILNFRQAPPYPHPPPPPPTRK